MNEGDYRALDAAFRAGRRDAAMPDRYDPEEARRNTEAVAGAGPEPPPVELRANGEGDGPRALVMTTDLSVAPGPRRWLVKDWILYGRTLMLYGEGGSGKTQLAAQLAHNLADGASHDRRWFDGGPEICEPASSVVYLSWEDDLDELKRRLLQHPDYAFAGAAELHRRTDGRLRLMDGAGFGPLWTPGARNGIGMPTEFADRVKAQAEADGARLIVIDSLASAFAASEIARPEVRAFASHFDGWGRRVGCAVVIVAHPSRSNADYSGSTDWRNFGRSMLTFEKIGNGRASLTRNKANYAAEGTAFDLADWKWWKIAAPGAEPPPDVQDTRTEAAIVDLLTEHCPEPLSKSAIEGALVYKGSGIGATRLRRTIARMELAGTLTRDSGSRGAVMLGLAGEDEHDLDPDS